MNAHRIAIVLILLVAAGLRLTGITWGQPADSRPLLHEQTPLHPDEYFYVAIPAEMLRDGRLNPQFFENPSLLINLNFATFALTGVSDVPDAALRQIAPFHLYVIGRVYSALGGLLLVAALYAVARMMGGRFAGLCAAILAAVSLPLVQHSHYATTSSLAAGFVALSMAASFAALKIKPRYLLLAGIAAGLAAGCRYNAAAVSLIPFVTGLILLTRDARNGRWIVAGWLAFPLVFLVTSPFVLLDFEAFWQQFQFITSRFTTFDPDGMTTDNGLFFTLRYMLMFGIGIPAALMIPAAWWYAWRKRPDDLLAHNSPMLYSVILLWYFIPYSFVVLDTTMPQIGDQLTLPALPVLIVWVALGAAWLDERVFLPRSVIVGVLVVVPLTLTLPFVYRLTQPDTRQQMQTWVRENIPPDATITLMGAYNVPLPGYDVVQHFDFAPENLETPRDYLIISDGVPFFQSRLDFAQPAPELTQTLRDVAALQPSHRVWRSSHWGDNWMMNNAAYWHNPTLTVYCWAACGN